MKFSINKTELQNALAVVQKGTSTRSTLPVLSGILIDASGDRLVFQATDLELSIQMEVPALIEEPGKIVVPGKLFSDIVKSLPDAAVSVSSESAESLEARINCDNTAFSVKTLNPVDFPGFPTVSPEKTIKIPFAVFSKMVKQVSRVVSRDESRAILTGVLVETEGAKLRMVATDSYRLALTEVEIDSEAYDGADDFSAVISGTFLSDIAGLSMSEQTVSIGLSENQIIVRCDDMVFIHRRIEGQYPNYRQLIPDSYITRAKFPVDQLTAAVRRAALMSSTTAPLKFTLAAPVNLAQITVTSNDVGSVQENIDCPIEGEEVEIAFNSSYVSDGLSTMREDEVYFEVQSSLKPGIFRSAGEDNHLYLIMPVRI